TATTSASSRARWTESALLGGRGGDVELLVQPAEGRPGARLALGPVLGASDGPFVRPLVEHVATVAPDVLADDVGEPGGAARVARDDELLEQVAVLRRGADRRLPAAAAVPVHPLLVRVDGVLRVGLHDEVGDVGVVFDRAQQPEEFADVV